MRALISILVLCAIAPDLQATDPRPARDLSELFAPDQAGMFWRQTRCDLTPVSTGILRIGFHKGYETTGIESSRLPFQDWPSWRSFRFDVENQTPEPLSVYVRISSRTDPPASDTY